MRAKQRKKVSKNGKKHVRNEAGKWPENEVATRNFHPSSVSLATLIPRRGNKKRGDKDLEFKISGKRESEEILPWPE